MYVPICIYICIIYIGNNLDSYHIKFRGEKKKMRINVHLNVIDSDIKEGCRNGFEVFPGTIKSTSVTDQLQRKKESIKDQTTTASPPTTQCSFKSWLLRCR